MAHMHHILDSQEKILNSSAVENSVKVCCPTRTMSGIAMAAVNNYGFELIEHAPYVPDFTPSDSHLFPELRKAILSRVVDLLVSVDLI